MGVSPLPDRVRYVPGHAVTVTRRWRLADRTADMRPPTDDDVPIVSRRQPPGFAGEGAGPSRTDQPGAQRATSVSADGPLFNPSRFLAALARHVVTYLLAGDTCSASPTAPCTTPKGSHASSTASRTSSTGLTPAGRWRDSPSTACADTWATLALQAGIDIKIVSDQLNHSSTVNHTSPARSARTSCRRCDREPPTGSQNGSSARTSAADRPVAPSQRRGRRAPAGSGSLGKGCISMRVGYSVGSERSIRSALPLMSNPKVLRISEAECDPRSVRNQGAYAAPGFSPGKDR